MTAKEKQILFKVAEALQAVEAAKNPANINRISHFYYGMLEVRTAACRVLRGLYAPSYDDEVDDDLKHLAEVMRSQSRQERLLHDGRGGWWNDEPGGAGQ